MSESELPEKNLDEVAPGETPAAVKVAGLDPEFGERFANLVAAATGGVKQTPRTGHPSYEGGFDDSRMFLSSVLTRVDSLVDDADHYQRAVKAVLDEVVRHPIERLVQVYKGTPDLDAVLAGRAVNATRAS